MLACLKNFLANEWDKANRLKRGGGREILSWDKLAPEERYRLEPADGATPETLFDRRWMQTLVAQALARLRAEAEREGTSQRFDVLKVFLSSDPRSVSYAEPAARLGISENAVKCAVRRLRARYSELFREEVGHTVGGPEEVEAEIRELFAAMG